MLKVLLRAFIEILVWTALIPFKLLLILALMVLVPFWAIKGYLTVRESIASVYMGFKTQLAKELHWVKTGEIES